jgi:hypothetical protein
MTMTYEGNFVGRYLTIDRVRQLNAKDWFYQMLKDNPNMTAIYPGIENDLMKGAIDHHIHAFPDFVQRSQDMIEIAIDASKAGMRAVGFKDHWNHTGAAAYLTQRYIDDMVKRGELEHRVEVFGGIGLNFGMNPHTVEEGLKYPNTKMLWFPTFESGGYKRGAGKPTDDGKSVWLVDDNGEVLPNVKEIIDMAASHKVGIGGGHTDFQELLPVCTYAQKVGARIVLDHPLLELNKLTMEEMKALAAVGAYVGTYCQPMIPSLYECVADPFETVKTIAEVGAEHCIVGSDFGQVLHVFSIEGVRIFIRALLGFGVTAPEIKIMLSTNVEKLLYWD